MWNRSRFGCPSSSLALRALLRKARRALWICSAVGVAIHASLTGIAGTERGQEVAKPLTTQFVKRQPRLTKPLELKKRPQPKRRAVQRTMVAVKARAGRQERVGVFQPSQVLHGLAHPGVAVGRGPSFSAEDLEPKSVAGMVHVDRETKDIVDMSLEMLDIEALETGRYQAVIVQDSNDKRSVRGYFHFWMAWPLNLSDDTYHMWPDRVKYAIRKLVLKMSQWTEIKTDIKGIIGFDSEQLLDTPWVVLSYAFKMYPTDAELRNMCRYMNIGGFLYTEGDTKSSDQCRVIRAALESGGCEEFKVWTWEPLPSGHGLFHCYFDFPDGPPPGGASVAHALWPGSSPAPDPPQVQAIQLGGRIVAITNNAGYVGAWGDWGTDCMPSMRGSEYSSYEPQRQLQFGVNTIVFALTQEGSITHRLMDSIQY